MSPLAELSGRRTGAGYVQYMRVAACAVAVMSVAACGGGGDGGGSSITTPPPVAVGSVAVTLPAAQVQVGAQLTAQAEVRSAAGAALSGRVVAWSSSNGAVATVTDGGVITGVAPGTVSITATSEGRSGSASLTVVPVPVASIVVSAPTPSVVVGQTLALSVSVRAADGSVLTGRPVEYSSSSTAVATVSNTGVVTGIAPGAVTITVRSGAVEGSIAITVLPVPVASITLSAPATTLETRRTLAVSATLRAADGAVLTGRSVDWESSNTAVATVSPAGVVTGVARGTVTITARSGSVSGSLLLTVTPPPVASVTVTSPITTIVVGGTTQLQATLRAADGTLLEGREVQWVSGTASIATVNNGGLVTAIAPGTVTISATSEGRTGALVLTVQPPAPASVVVTPGSLSLLVGGSAALTASVRDAGGNTLPGERVTWTTSNPAVVTAQQNGTITATGTGVATISATAGGRTGSAVITVQNAPVASVSLNFSGINLLVGDVRLLVATARDAAGNVLTGRPVAWNTSNSTVVNGQVFGDTAIITGVSTGSATVTATVEGRSASVLVVVAPAGPVSVCTLIAGALLFGDDGQYLGRFTNRFDSQSVLNEFGTYGSRFSSTSTNNEFGTYGSNFSSLSAWNPFASRPPLIVRNGQFVAYYTVNTARTPRVSPAVALSCNFP